MCACAATPRRVATCGHHHCRCWQLPCYCCGCRSKHAHHTSNSSVYSGEGCHDCLVVCVECGCDYGVVKGRVRYVVSVVLTTSTSTSGNRCKQRNTNKHKQCLHGFEFELVGFDKLWILLTTIDLHKCSPHFLRANPTLCTYQSSPTVQQQQPLLFVFAVTMLRVVLAAFVVTMVVVGQAHAVVPGDEITSLPGWSGALPSRQFSGYMPVGPAKDRFIHYWFVESENDPSTDPVGTFAARGGGAGGGGYVKKGTVGVTLARAHPTNSDVAERRARRELTDWLLH